MARYSEMYLLKASGRFTNGKQFKFEESRSVGEFFTKEGQLVITAVEEFVPQLLAKIKNL